jgi:uncharacterized repeat protein (TIGR03833 family)
VRSEYLPAQTGGRDVDGTRRADIKAGSRVRIVLKQDQLSGRLTEGTVQDVLTNSPEHPHGIKVRLETGEVGRVKQIIP